MTGNNPIELAVNLLRYARGYCALTGAGCSIESGLPAYRDERGNWKHSKPMEHQDFVSSPMKRKYYWARSMQGWPDFQKAKPSQTHTMLSRLQKSGYINQIITQNVDRLHQAAGSDKVIDLHGRLDQVICLGCHRLTSRSALQKILEVMNTNIRVNKKFLRPDGDVDLEDKVIEEFSVPGCTDCGGVLKPNVVFFGDVLANDTVVRAVDAVQRASGLLVVGSSLMVYSGFSLVKQALELNKPVIIINRGLTRADELKTIKIERESGQALHELMDELARAC